MLTSEAHVRTDRPERYAKQLCSHLAHRIHAEWMPPEGVADFPDLGTCRLSARANELAIVVEALDEDALAQVQDIVASHHEHFGERDDLRVAWSAPSGTAARSKTPGLDPAIYGYMRANSTPPDEVGRALIAETRRQAPELAGMQVTPEQGAFLTMLARLSGTRFAVELGTFTGFSALCIARGLPPDGKLLTVDIDERASFGEPYWERAGVSDKIELRIGDARDVLRSLPDEPLVDLAFVDADKDGYPAYHEELVTRLAPNGLILYDNTLAGGGVLTDAPEDWVADMRRFNEILLADERVEQVLLPIGDGLTLVQRRSHRAEPQQRNGDEMTGINERSRSLPTLPVTPEPTRRTFLGGAGGLLALGLAAYRGGAVVAQPATPAATPVSRTVEHARGTTEVPADPQRVMALGEEFLLADLLTLGAPVVASTATVAAEGFSGLDGFDTDGIDVLDATEPDLERLVAVDADLIVATPFVWDRVGGDLLAAIAPTVVVEESDDGWRATLLAMGQLLGQETAADQALDAYDATVTGARGVLAPEGRTVSIATIYPGAALAVWIDGPTNIAQTVLDLGFTLEPGPGSVPDAEDGRAFLSIEQLQLLTGDDLIMLQSSAVEGEDEAFQETLAEPIWQTLPAVQADRVSVIDRLGYPGIAGRQRLIVDLVDALNRGA